MIGNQFDEWARGAGYKATGGYFHAQPLPFTSALWDDNGTLKAQAINAAGTVGFKYIDATSKMIGAVWGATADNTDSLVFPWMVPWNYRRNTARTGAKTAIILAAKVFKLDTTGSAAENADLELRADIGFHSPTISDSTGLESDGDTAYTAVTATKFTTMAGATVIPAMAASTVEEKWRWMFADLSAAMTAAQLSSIKPGAGLDISVYPHEAVGTALNVCARDFHIIYTGHLQPANSNIKNKCLRA